jgi:hypothetical protein
VATWWLQGLTWHHGALFWCNRGHSWMYLGYRTCCCTVSAVGPKIVLSRSWLTIWWLATGNGWKWLTSKEGFRVTWLGTLGNGFHGVQPQWRRELQ